MANCTVIGRRIKGLDSTVEAARCCRGGRLHSSLSTQGWGADALLHLEQLAAQFLQATYNIIDRPGSLVAGLWSPHAADCQAVAADCCGRWHKVAVATCPILLCFRRGAQAAAAAAGVNQRCT